MELEPFSMAPDLQSALLGWYEEHQRDLPWRKTRDPYGILVAEVMLQQTQVERVILKYHEFLRRFPTIEALAEAPVAEVIRAWSPLGYNLRAVRLHRLAQEVVAHRNGQLPKDPDALRQLPGVGRYTAAAVTCFAYGAQVAVVDANIRRVLGRALYGLRKPREAELWAAAQSALPMGQAASWNQAIMDLGATVCFSRRPRCLVCPLRAWCRAAPHLGTPTRQVAERRAGYRAQPPFAGSTRYYRGRVVQYLRGLEAGERVPAAVLGCTLKVDFAQEDDPWLAALLQRLARDGLIAVHHRTGSVESDGLGQMEVSLP